MSENEPVTEHSRFLVALNQYAHRGIPECLESIDFVVRGRYAHNALADAWDCRESEEFAAELRSRLLKVRPAFEDAVAFVEGKISERESANIAETGDPSRVPEGHPHGAAYGRHQIRPGHVS